MDASSAEGFRTHDQIQLSALYAVSVLICIHSSVRIDEHLRAAMRELVSHLSFPLVRAQKGHCMSHSSMTLRQYTHNRIKVIDLPLR